MQENRPLDVVLKRENSISIIGAVSVTFILVVRT
jgi:hypothetical protein